MAVERDFAESFNRFEPARDILDQAHLICSTRAVRDSWDERLELTTILLGEAEGHTLRGHRLAIYRLQPECQRGGCP